MIDLKIFGEAEAVRKFATAGSRAQAAVDKRARSLGEEMADAMRGLVPVDTGALLNSIRVDPDGDSSGVVVRAGGTSETQRRPGHGGRKAFVFDEAVMVEYGTAPHRQRPVKRRRRGAGKTHPGTPAQPFFNPVVNDFRDRIAAELSEAAAEATTETLGE